MLFCRCKEKKKKLSRPSNLQIEKLFFVCRDLKNHGAIICFVFCFFLVFFIYLQPPAGRQTESEEVQKANPQIF